MPSQSSVSINGSLQLLKSPLQESLSIENQVAQAEVFQAFHVVAANHSFSSTNEDFERFKYMFPDSKIAARYSQHAHKTWYVIVYGISSYVKNLLINDVKNTFFVINSAKPQHLKNQYDGYVTYFSKEYQQIITGFYGSFFVGHCNSQALVSHFYEFLESLKLSSAWLINIGMDDPLLINPFFISYN